MNALFIGVDSRILDFAVGILKPTQAKIIEKSDEFFHILDQPEDWDFGVVIAGPLIQEINVNEIAQSVKAVATSTPIYYCHHSRESGYDRKIFIKNGFTDAFLIPFDSEAFREALEETIAKFKHAEIYRPVRVFDISSETVLPFDLFIYLPRNQKYIQYSRAGHPIEEARVQKLLNHHIGSVFVPLDQMPKFFDYTAIKLKELKGLPNSFSETENRMRLQSSVRTLLTDIFATSGNGDFDEGRKMLTDAGEIVKSFMQISNEGDLYSKILRIIGDVSSSYSHLSNVSTVAALFSMATGIGEPEELALAGLFHDLGLSAVPHEIQLKEPHLWNEEERKIFERHPEYSLNLIKEKKVVLPQGVQAMILQHHEHIDGKGYPRQLSGHKFREDAQLLAVADRFDELTQVKSGQKRSSPLEAIQQIQSENVVSSHIIDRLLPIFKPAGEPVTAKAS